MAPVKLVVVAALFVAVAGVVVQARAPFSSPTSAPEPSEDASISSPPKHSPASSPLAYAPSVSSPPAPTLNVKGAFVSTPASSPSEDNDEADAPAFGPGPSPDSFVDYEAADEAF